MKKTTGFTLIEILVVISIIAVLMALLFPVFANARAKSHQSGCQSNLRQIGFAISLYAQDYDSLYPFACDPVDKNIEAWGGLPRLPDTVKTMPYLYDTLFPYLKNKQIWQCPSDTGFPINSFLNDDVGIQAPFACNSFYEKVGTSYVYRTDLAISQVRYPASGIDPDNHTEQGPSEVNVLSDVYGRWHSHAEGLDSERYHFLMADNHVIVRSFFASQRSHDLIPK